MKTIQHNAIITSIRSRKDRSISYSVETPELSHQEKALFFELQNLNVVISILPKDELEAPEYKVEKDIDQKSPSSRMRNVIYILYKQSGDNRDFELYYKNTMEVLIQKLKEKIENV
jgi:hypothetical protein